jgi:hypothetical protein
MCLKGIKNVLFYVLYIYFINSEDIKIFEFDE